MRTVDRSERIRTYNYAENRIADHRIGFKAYNLDAVLNGELAPSSAPCRRPTPRRASPRWGSSRA